LPWPTATVTERSARTQDGGGAGAIAHGVPGAFGGLSDHARAHVLFRAAIVRRAGPGLARSRGVATEEDAPLPPVRWTDELASGRELITTLSREAPLLRRRATQWLGAALERHAADAAQAILGGLVSARPKVAGGGPLCIEGHRGFATAEQAWLSGRVVAGAPGRPPQRNASRTQNLRHTLGDFLRYGVPGARVRVRLGQNVSTVNTDAHGYFETHLPCPHSGTADWLGADLELAQSPLAGSGRATSRAEILVPAESARHVFVSDIDDTVLQAHTDGWIRMAAVAAWGNAFTRLPVDAVGSFYRALVAGPTGSERNPMFYVSRGPWNLYSFLVAFLEHHCLPKGPLLLRGLGNGQAPARAFKGAAIGKLLELYPRRPFVLLGDGCEDDAEVYLEVARLHPGRVRAIYIRDPRGRVRGDRGLVVVATTGQASAHARRAGLIASQESAP
jgi:phosphatidate phosphatase APP1